MLTILHAGEDGLVAVDTSNGVPQLEIACGRCRFQMTMIAFAPIASSADATAMATALIDQHSTASHPERVR